MGLARIGLSEGIQGFVDGDNLAIPGARTQLRCVIQIQRQSTAASFCYTFGARLPVHALLDPKYAQAYSTLAYNYINQDDWFIAPKIAGPRAKAAAGKALALNESDAGLIVWTRQNPAFIAEEIR